MHELKLKQEVFNSIFQYLNWVNQLPEDFRERADFDQLEKSIFGPNGVDQQLIDGIDELSVLDYSVTDYSYIIRLAENVNEIRLFVCLDDDDDDMHPSNEAEFVFTPE